MIWTLHTWSVSHQDMTTVLVTEYISNDSILNIRKQVINNLNRCSVIHVYFVIICDKDVCVLTVISCWYIFAVPMSTFFYIPKLHLLFHSLFLIIDVLFSPPSSFTISAIIFCYLMMLMESDNNNLSFLAC